MMSLTDTFERGEVKDCYDCVHHRRYGLMPMAMCNKYVDNTGRSISTDLARFTKCTSAAIGFEPKPQKPWWKFWS